MGVVGDGTTDDTAAIQAALQPGATVTLPPGTYLLSQVAGQPYALDLPNGCVLRGSGRGVTKLKLKAGQDKWTRAIRIEGRSDVTIADFTYDGNEANQPAGNDGEQQHFGFVDDCDNVTFDNVEVHSTAGDGIYLFGGTRHTIIRGCRFFDTRRVKIHVQDQEHTIVDGCHFWNTSGFGQAHIKSETDQAGASTGLTIGRCTFDGDSTAFGILLGGISDEAPYSDVSITGCAFRGLDTAIGLGIYLRDVAISGNLIKGCKGGIASTNYATDYGYAAQRNVVISGNTIVGFLGDSGQSPNVPGIGLFNCRGAVVAGNLIEGAGKYPLVFHHCDGLTLSGDVRTSHAAAVGLRLYRSKNVFAHGFRLTLTSGSTGSIGVHAADDETYPSSALKLGTGVLAGAMEIGFHGVDLTGTTLNRSAVEVGGAGTISIGDGITNI